MIFRLSSIVLKRQVHSNSLRQIHRSNVQQILKDGIKAQVPVEGWVKSVRKQKRYWFIELNDGSTIENLQLIVNPENLTDEDKNISMGCSLKVLGDVVESRGQQNLELQVKDLKVLGTCCPEDYPLQKQKKSHTNEYLREVGYIRPRTTTMSSILRARSTLVTTIFKTLDNLNYINVPTPVLTSHDCEGGGDVFKVSSGTDEPYFPTSTYLTVSTQLHLELMASSIRNVYTLSPTFRAEKSDTSRHLSEFSMLEIESSFLTDMEPLLNLSELLVKECVSNYVQSCAKELLHFSQTEPQLPELLESVVKNEFHRVSYRQALELVNQHSGLPKLEFGDNLNSEAEKFLATQHFKQPVFITNYPKSQKPFYMKTSSTDPDTVDNFDLLLPNIGELIGGSLRESDYNQLKLRMEKENINNLDWYLNLRKFGSTQHGGFGLGLERLLQFVTGIKHIRDLSPYPRHFGTCRY